jgi:hypothetical protein
MHLSNKVIICQALAKFDLVTNFKFAKNPLLSDYFHKYLEKILTTKNNPSRLLIVLNVVVQFFRCC